MYSPLCSLLLFTSRPLLSHVPVRTTTLSFSCGRYPSIPCIPHASQPGSPPASCLSPLLDAMVHAHSLPVGQADCDFAVHGMAVMGENLARNIESRGFTTALSNRSYGKVCAKCDLDCLGSVQYPSHPDHESALSTWCQWRVVRVTVAPPPLAHSGPRYFPPSRRLAATTIARVVCSTLTLV